VAVGTGVYVVHSILVFPNLVGAGPQHDDADAEQARVSYLRARSLTLYYCLYILIAIWAYQSLRHSLVELNSQICSIEKQGLLCIGVCGRLLSRTGRCLHKWRVFQTVAQVVAAFTLGLALRCLLLESFLTFFSSII